MLNNVTNGVDYVCLCSHPYTGENCEINGRLKKNGLSVSSKIKANHSLHILTNSLSLCFKAYSINLLFFFDLDVNPCDPNPCKTNENCILSTIDSTYSCEPLNLEMINLCEIKQNICNENSVCTFNQADNGYYCKCVDLDDDNVQDSSRTCNYPINYKDFFENDTLTTPDSTSTTTTSAAAARTATIPIDQQEETALLESKNNLKLFNATFNTENVSIQMFGKTFF